MGGVQRNPRTKSCPSLKEPREGPRTTEGACRASFLKTKPIPGGQVLFDARGKDEVVDFNGIGRTREDESVVVGVVVVVGGGMLWCAG